MGYACPVRNFTGARIFDLLLTTLVLGEILRTVKESGLCQ